MREISELLATALVIGIVLPLAMLVLVGVILLMAVGFFLSPLIIVALLAYQGWKYLGVYLERKRVASH